MAQVDGAVVDAALVVSSRSIVASPANVAVPAPLRRGRLHLAVGAGSEALPI